MNLPIMFKGAALRAFVSGVAFTGINLLFLDASAGKAVVTGVMFGFAMLVVEAILAKFNGGSIAEEAARMKNLKPGRSRRVSRRR